MGKIVDLEKYINSLKMVLSKHSDDNTSSAKMTNKIFEKFLEDLEAIPTIVSQEDIEVLKIIKEHFQVCFDSDSDNGLDTIVFNGFDLDKLWEDGYDEEFEKVKNWLWKG